MASRALSASRRLLSSARSIIHSRALLAQSHPSSFHSLPAICHQNQYRNHQTFLQQHRRDLTTSIKTPSPTSPSQKANNSSGFFFPGPRKLKDIVKLPLLERKSALEIKEIWNKYHEGKRAAVADVLSDNTHGLLRQRAQRCPFFVLPVYRKENYFNLIIQWQDSYCLATYLEDYKKNPTAAMPYATFSIYNDLMVTKQIALVRGEVTNMLTSEEGKKVWELIKRFYAGEERNWQVVRRFNEEGEKFRFEDVLRIAK